MLRRRNIPHPRRLFRACVRLWLLGLLLLVGACGTVGVNRSEIRAPSAKAFDEALVEYAAGNLDQAQVSTLVAMEDNPLDTRATDLMRAILKEKGLIDEVRAAVDPPLPDFTPSSPAELVRVIDGRNPIIRQAVFGVIEARARLREANVDMGPEISVFTRFYPLGILARLTQSLYGGWWERKAKMHAAEAAIVEALAQYGQAQRDINRESLLAYLDAVAARERLTSLDREHDLLDEQQEQAIVLVRYGQKLPREPLLVRNEIGALQSEQAAAYQQLATAKARLNALMNRAPDAPIGIRAQGLLWQPADTLDGALTAAYVNRFEMDEAQAQTKIAEARQALSKLEDPDVDLVATYGESGRKSEGSFLKGFSIGAVTRFPLAIIPLKKARADEHDAIIRQFELREQQVHNEIAVEVVDAYHGWDTARSELRNERAGLALAKEDRRVAAAERKAEVADDPLALNRAEIDHIRAERAVLERSYDVQRSLVELSSTVGADVAQIKFVDADSPAHWNGMFDGPSAPGTRALWVWRKDFLNSSEDMEFFVELLMVRKIGTVFLYVTESDLITKTQILSQFLELATRSNIEVQALNGEHKWLLNEQQVRAAEYVDQVIKFNAENPIEKRFSAVHLDVEPHTLPSWEQTEGKDRLLFSYIVLLDSLKAARTSIPLIVDVPAWFADREVDGIWLSDMVTRRADGVVYMAYGTKTARRNELIKRISGTAASGSTRFWIGVSADQRHLCPLPLGENFEVDLAELESSLNVVTEFAGVAIHDFDRYRDLLLGIKKYSPTTTRGGCLQAGIGSPTGG